MYRIYIKSIWPLDSPYYKYLVNYPPEDVVYVNFTKRNKESVLVIEKKKFAKRVFMKRILIKSLGLLNVIKISKFPNINNIDLIHSARTFLITKKPYVIDFEHYWTLAVSSKSAYSSIGKHLIRKFLLKENVKRILPWTYAALNSIPKEIKENKKIREKLEVVYPAVPLPSIQKSKKVEDTTTLLFIGRYFYMKGGPTVLKVFKKLRSKYDVKLIVVSNVPNIVLKKYRRFEGIEFYDSVPDSKLREIFTSSDVYVYPGYSDTFGFTILEAMSYGLPVVTSSAFAREELVENWKTGFIIKRGKNEIKEYVGKLSLIIEDDKLRKEMSKNARREIESGKFSIKERNKRLKKIYEESIGAKI